MRTIRTYGNYSIIQYDDNFVAIDFSNESVGMTIQTFTGLVKALEVFKNTVETMSEHKALFHDTDVVKMIINE